MKASAQEVSESPGDRAGLGIIGVLTDDSRVEVDMVLRVQHLRKQLAESLAAEQYERAAAVRDQIISLGYAIEGGSGDDDAAPVSDDTVE